MLIEKKIFPCLLAYGEILALLVLLQQILFRSMSFGTEESVNVFEL